MTKNQHTQLKLYRMFKAGQEKSEDQTKFLKLMIQHHVLDGTEWLDERLDFIQQRYNEWLKDFASVELVRVFSDTEPRSFVFHCEFRVHFISKSHFHKFKLMHPEVLGNIIEDMNDYQDVREHILKNKEIVHVPTNSGYFIELFK